MVFDKWMELMPRFSTTHLPIVGSDHSPLLMEIIEKDANPIKYFMILNCWTKLHCFMETFRSYCNRNENGNPMFVFHYKLKRLAPTLSNQSKSQLGDVFAKVKISKRI